MLRGFVIQRFILREKCPNTEKYGPEKTPYGHFSLSDALLVQINNF